MENTLDGLSLSPASSQTSLIRMQVAALLEEQSVNYEAKRRKAEPALQEVKRALLSLPSREPILAHEIEKVFTAKSPHVRVPFPTVRPPKSAKHRYGFAPPAEVEIIGSYAIQTLVRDESSPYIDMAVVMPEQLLEAKDYLDYRYIHKKAFYLACIAEGLRANLASYDMTFGHLNENELQPYLKLNPSSDASERSRRWSRIRIFVGPPVTLFKPEKLRPWAQCLRQSTTNGVRSQLGTSPASPLYNGTIASERLFGSYFALQKHTTVQFPGFKNACMLGKIWLRQRGFSSELSSGGFGAFEFSVILALFLQRNHNVKIALPASESDGFQLFRSLIQVLASRNVVNEPLIFGKPSDGISLSSDGSLPLVYDCEREHNLTFKMSVSSAELLRLEARTTASALIQTDPHQFYPTFIARVGSGVARFDHVLNGTILLQPATILQMINNLHQTLVLALRDRASLVHITIHDEDTPEDWPCISAPPQQRTKRELRIGILANPMQIARRVDLGPLAEETEAAAKYRDFWGPKAELRRFANGEIRESVTWPASRGDVETLNWITAHVVARHFSKGVVSISDSIGEDFTNMLHPSVPTLQALSIFSSAEEAFTKLQESLRSISGHPLRLRQVSASASGLRYASIVQPDQLKGTEEPLGVVVQFEGSVRWPDDIIAIQHTKAALLSKMADLLESGDHVSNATVGLEDVQTNFASRAFLDLQIGQVSFRLRIHHDHEVTLLSRFIKDPSLSPRDRALAATAVSEHKRRYVHGPRHTQAIREFCTRMPLVSSTIRLFKHWVSSHLLLPHFREELLELVTIHTFDRPFPYASPGSLRTAFLRTLLFLSRWDWQNEPLILSLTTTALTRSDIDNIITNFQAWRKIDPVMQRVTLFVASDIDIDGTTWSAQSPSVVAVNRLTSLARAACAEVLQSNAVPRAQPLFSSSMKDFDFVLHLNQATFQHSRKRAASNGMASLSEIASGGDIDRICRLFIHELERTFAGYVAFFHNYGSMPVIAGVWAPRESMRGLKLGASWMTVPQVDGKELDASIFPNQNEVLHQIACLGGNLITRIEVGAEARD